MNTLVLCHCFLKKKKIIQILKKADLEKTIYNKSVSNYLLLFSLGASYGNVEFLFISLMSPAQIVTVTSTNVNGLILLDILGQERRIMII